MIEAFSFLQAADVSAGEAQSSSLEADAAPATQEPQSVAQEAGSAEEAAPAEEAGEKEEEIPEPSSAPLEEVPIVKEESEAPALSKEADPSEVTSAWS